MHSLMRYYPFVSMAYVSSCTPSSLVGVLASAEVPHGALEDEIGAKVSCAFTVRFAMRHLQVPPLVCIDGQLPPEVARDTV